MRVHHLAFRTRDLPRLVDFYRAIFGLAVAGEQPGRSVWLALDGAVLMLERGDASEEGYPRGSLELFALAVDAAGREAVRERLRARGVPLEAETLHTSYFRDPDGRRVAVSTHPLVLDPPTDLAARASRA